MRNPLPRALSAGLLASCALVAGCSGRSQVSLTGNSPAQYSHFWITAQEVWFNANAAAGPADSGWKKFPLSTPVTVDLVQQTGGNLGSVFTSLKLLPDTYSQIRFIPVNYSTPLTASAQAAGAIWNNEADYVDASGTTHQLLLELLDPEQGFGIQASLKVPIGNIGAALKTVRTVTTPTTTTTGSTSTTSTTPATTLSNTNSTPKNEFAIYFDGATDLVPFSYSAAKTVGILLSSHATAYNLAEVGGISGQLTLTNLIGISGNTGTPAIQATAELLSADGTRHEAVLSTPVDAQGNFLLYPLPTSSSSPAYYDVVIHGPAMATIVVKSVKVTLSKSAPTPSPYGSTGSSTGSSSTSSTSTNGTVNSVSLGTLIPRAATSYTANLTTTPAESLPAGAQVGFYQTLAAAGEVPYLIESSPIDPFNQVLFNAQGLSEGTVDSGTFTADGANVRVVSAAAAEGAGGYLVAASAPDFANGALTSKVSAPSSGTTTPVLVTIPTLSLAATAGTISAAVTESSPGRYDQGELLVSHEGQLVASASLNAAFAQGGRGTITVGVPAETSASLYYLTVRAWNSTDPAGTLQLQWYPTSIDLRSTATGSTELTVN